MTFTCAEVIRGYLATGRDFPTLYHFFLPDHILSTRKRWTLSINLMGRSAGRQWGRCQAAGQVDLPTGHLEISLNVAWLNLAVCLLWVESNLKNPIQIGLNNKYIYQHKSRGGPASPSLWPPTLAAPRLHVSLLLRLYFLLVAKIATLGLYFLSAYHDVWRRQQAGFQEAIIWNQGEFFSPDSPDDSPSLLNSSHSPESTSDSFCVWVSLGQGCYTNPRAKGGEVTFRQGRRFPETRSAVSFPKQTGCEVCISEQKWSWDIWVGIFMLLGWSRNSWCWKKAVNNILHTWGCEFCKQLFCVCALASSC